MTLINILFSIFTYQNTFVIMGWKCGIYEGAKIEQALAARAANACSICWDV